jgi:hypothetical protein
MEDDEARLWWLGKSIRNQQNLLKSDELPRRVMDHVMCPSMGWGATPLSRIIPVEV